MINFALDDCVESAKMGLTESTRVISISVTTNTAHDKRPFTAQGASLLYHNSRLHVATQKIKINVICNILSHSA